ncbi:MAG: hypothetical protein JXB32_06785, partial [Deltaproteobacteria bacterium]|nr:hypothetical protein [Deltaproteobacteria bacterium]
EITRAYLDAGTYWVAVDGEEYPFTLGVTLGEPVVPPANDRCSGAADVSAGGSFTGDLARSYRDYPPSCSTGAYLDADVVYRFTTAAARDVSVQVSPVAGTGTFAVALRSACADPATELRCRASGTSASFLQHDLPAGTYYLIVSGSSAPSASRFLLQVGFSPPTPAPAGDTCADAIHASAGGSFPLTADSFDDDHATRCGPSNLPDAVFRLGLSEPRDLTLALSAGSDPSTLQLYAGACGTTSFPAGCISNTAPSGTIRGVPAGDYWLVVDAAPRYVGTLDVTLTLPE